MKEGKKSIIDSMEIKKVTYKLNWITPCLYPRDLVMINNEPVNREATYPCPFTMEFDTLDAAEDQIKYLKGTNCQEVTLLKIETEQYQYPIYRLKFETWEVNGFEWK